MTVLPVNKTTTHDALIECRGSTGASNKHYRTPVMRHSLLIFQCTQPSHV